MLSPLAKKMKKSTQCIQSIEGETMDCADYIDPDQKTYLACHYSHMA